MRYTLRAEGVVTTAMPSTSIVEVESVVMTTTVSTGVMQVERVLACLRTDVARWAYQDRVDAGVAADLGHYLQRLQDVVDGLVDAEGVGSTDTPADRKGVRSADPLCSAEGAPGVPSGVTR